MSGSPKMVTMFVEGQGYVTVTERQAAALERAAKARGEAAERERQRQLRIKMQQLVVLAGDTRAYLQGIAASLPAGKAVSYEQELDRLDGIVNTSTDPGAVFGAELALHGMRRRLETLLAQAREEAANAEASGELDAELARFDQRLNALRDAGGADLDASGRAAAVAAVNLCRAVMHDQGVDRRQTAHASARHALEQHAAALEAAQERQAVAQQQAETILAEAQQLASGLESDELVQRWAAPRAAELVARVAGWQAALAAGNPAAVTAAALEELKLAEKGLLDQVAAAQFKSEQRDYILQSVREVLTEMGFMLGPAEAETPGHPATAMRFSAVNAVGQAMDVSVPIEGEVWYEVDGFQKSTEAKVGGGTAAVCDSAQRVIEEMHHEIEEQFGIKSGELTWEGKDPDRILRQMDELPSSGDGQERGGRT